mmetsp:Transcript_3155/g.3944  ORF Transcript_3155/g.3944 Transcript_3155/m.3944 type:complete len:142 (+) Transcript_3155:35-460(+)
MAAPVNVMAEGMLDSAVDDKSRERGASDASTVEPACSEKLAESDNEEEVEAKDASEDNSGGVHDLVVAVSLVLGVLLGALLVWLCLPAMISFALLGFLALQISWLMQGPTQIIPSWLSGFVLLPLYLCSWAVFLACQTPQL